MSSTKRILQGLVLILLQLVVFNKIHLFGYATPLLYVMLIINMPLTTPRWSSMLYGFVFGLMADIIVNTPGVAAASLTITGFMHQSLLGSFLDRNSDRVNPTISDMGFLGYAVYSLLCIVLYCVLFYSLWYFSFFHVETWCWSVLGTTLITWLLIVFIEAVRK